MAVVPFVFANQSGTIPLSQLDVNFANVKAFAETAGNVTGNIQANITAVGTLTSLTVSGNILADNFIGNVTGNVVGNLIGNVTGNISGNLTVAGGNTQVLFNDNGVANATAGMTFNKSTNVLTVGGNITSSNISVAGNIISSNITVNELITTFGPIFAQNISANNIFSNSITTTSDIKGNILLANSGIIGVPPGISTFFLGNTVSDTVFFAGNASNVYIANVNSTTQVAGNLTAGGSVSATGNITAGGSVSATGNITAGNVLTSGIVSSTGNITAGNVLTGLISASGNLTAGNLLTAGIISLSGNLTASGNTALSGNSTAVTAANGTNTTQIATTAFVVNAITNSAIPSGVILLWSGSIASVPAGWALCDGANGTPNLRDRFVVGAGSTYAVAATGGSANAIVISHTHTATSNVSDPGHTHVNGSFTELLAKTGTGTVTTTNSDPSEPQVTASANLLSNTTGITVTTTVNSTGSSGTNANLPPYYALAYIMKL